VAKHLLLQEPSEPQSFENFELHTSTELNGAASAQQVKDQNYDRYDQQ
jgi:hypothetical protein